MALYQTQPDRKLRAKALAKEYGIGGHSHDFLDGSRGFVNHDWKGLEFDHYPDHQKITLKWAQVEKYIDLMIQSDRYLTDEEKEQRTTVQEENGYKVGDDVMVDLPTGTIEGTIGYIGETDVRIDTSAHGQSWDNEVINKRQFEDGLRQNEPSQRVDEMLEQAETIYKESEVPEYERFFVREVVGGTSQLFAIWDDLNEGYYANDNGMAQFTDKEQAESYCTALKKETDERTAADWLAVEKAKFLAENEPVPALPKERDYRVGDTIRLDGKDFTVETVGTLNIQLRDPDEVYPVARSESKENLERLLRQPGNIHLHNLTVNLTPAHEPDEDKPPLTDEELDELPISNVMDGKVQTFPDAVALDEALNAEPAPEPAGNFHITDDHLGEGGAKQKYARNIEAIRTLFKLEQEHRGATAEEQQVLSQYVGWGGLADAFDPNKDGWAKEYTELKGLLSEDEYAAARSSTLNAHYTSPTVIRGIYDAVERMGFRSGNILEPSMGVGNFFGMLPDTMQDSRLYGVELDSITGRIAKKLYPQADITVAGFETTDRRDFYDLAVGNVPFGQYKVNDKAYNKLGFSIHNYFFAKAIDQVRPGGVVAFVTSRYTMDSKDSTARKHMAERADLLGAIRLPNNAFKANAGTEVVSDIIFLQKRDRPADIEPAWVQLGKTEDGFAISQYFVDHPEMVLGELTTESTQYGREELTVSPIEGANLSDQLAEAVQHIEGQYTEVEVDTPDIAEEETTRRTLPADPEVKNFSYTVVDGEVFYRENSVMTQVELSDTAKGRVTGMVELRQIVNELIQQQLEDYPDEDIKAAQERLNAAYGDFTAKYGLINDKKNARLFDDDSSYYLLCSLENLDENKNLKSKADMFTKRTIRPERVVTSVDTPSEALAVSIGEHGKVDLPYMAELLGTPGEYGRITTELSGVIFKDPAADVDDPEAGWQTADEYLSGNVRDKLRMAQLAAESHPEFKVNVDALTKAQPKDLEASEIDVRLGATWLAPSIVQQFMMETFQLPYRIRYNNAITVRYLYQTLENKQKFISQIMTSKSPMRSCDDIDEQALSYAEIKALCAGDPRIREKMDLDVQVAKLKVLRGDFQNQKYRLEDKLLKTFPEEIQKQKTRIAALQQDSQIAAAHPQDKENFCGMTIKGMVYDDKKAAGERLLLARQEMPNADMMLLGTYRGFELNIRFDSFKNEHQAVLRAELSYPVSLGDDARGNITRLDNAIDNFADRIADAENALQNLEQQKQAAEVEVAKPFAQEEELAEKSARLAELNALLNIDRDRSSSQDAPEETEETETPATRPSVLAALGEKTNQPEPVKPFRSYYDKDGDAR